jgi:hypothetical protein
MDGRVNVMRIFLDGFAAALVTCALDGLTNGVVFAKDWADAYSALHLPPSNGAIAGFWFAVDLLCGLLIAFLIRGDAPAARCRRAHAGARRYRRGRTLPRGGPGSCVVTGGA